MEGVLTKLYSSIQFINPIFSIPRTRCIKLKFQYSSTSFSATAIIHKENEDDASQYLLLGHITRPDFPILHQKVNKSKLVYLDKAATSQKPCAVLDILQNHYKTHNSNVHRGIHFFEIILTVAEYHSAIVPWQIMAQKTGATLKFVNLTEVEIPDISGFKKILSKRTKLVVPHHVSNTLAYVLPIKDITRWSHEVGAKVLVDACQNVPHMVVDVQSLDADFLVASSHKMCGLTGVGFLYGKREISSGMPPFLGSGEMISDVYLDHSTYAEPPSRLGAAIDYLSRMPLSRIGMQKIHDYEVEMGTYLYESLHSVPKVRMYGPAPSLNVNRAALCSFNVENIHPTDIATFLDQQYGAAV